MVHHGDPLTDCDLGIIRYCLGLLEIVNLNSGKIRELDMGQKVCGGTPAINMLLVRSLGWSGTMVVLFCWWDTDDMVCTYLPYMLHDKLHPRELTRDEFDERFVGGVFGLIWW